MMRPAVLIVEDDDAVRESVRLVLEDDCEVVGAPDGSTALTLAGTHLDAVILDLRLPDIDGLEVLRRIRLLAADMPVVILTADASARTAVGAMKLGASESAASIPRTRIPMLRSTPETAMCIP
jgi:DNA-binding response OmpR family regulator